MTNRLTLVKIFILSTMFLCAFYLFTGTSWFDFLIKVSGSFIYAVMLINLAVVGLIFLTIFTGVRLEKIINVVSLVLCFPSVLYNSKLNWLNMIWGIKVTDRNPFIVTCLILIYIVLGVFLVNMIMKYENQYEDWVISGADKSDIDKAHNNRLEILIFVVGFTAIPLFVVSILGTMTNLPRFSTIASVVFAVLGAMSAAATVFYFAGSGRYGKD